MKTFNEWLEEHGEIQTEAALIVSGKHAYPKFNQILCMAGGAGSGKGFVLNNVIAFTGKTFDVDDMKTKVINLARRNPDINLSKEFQKEYGKSLADINLKDPKDTSNLHVFLKKKGLDAKRKEIFFAQASGTKNKPNVIFDVTFKDMDAIEEVSACKDRWIRYKRYPYRVGFD